MERSRKAFLVDLMALLVHDFAVDATGDLAAWHWQRESFSAVA
jgi:hypothetical protein